MKVQNDHSGDCDDFCTLQHGKAAMDVRNTTTMKPMSGSHREDAYLPLDNGFCWAKCVRLWKN